MDEGGSAMNTYGTIFRVSLYGESHQPAIGVVIDGMPAGIRIDEDNIRRDLALRNPVAIGTTPRKEPDIFTITSGVYQSFSTGAPIHITVPNTNVRSQDYQALKDQPRPGHADFVARKTYAGFADPRGGGHFSGRLTACLVIAGSLAKMILPFTFHHQLIQVGTLKDMEQLDTYLATIASQQDSVGGIIRLIVKDIPVGLGEPFFHKLESGLGQALLSIPAVKALSFGTGFDGITLLGSQFNDRLIDESGTTATNHAGGISGGLSNGNPLWLDVFVKPPSSIAQKQNTYSFASKGLETLSVEGRHDVCIARRAGIVIENTAAFVLADFYLRATARQGLHHG
jgi:chorismate synthase